jgi:phage antirepressor YoqD-like protein
MEDSSERPKALCRASKEDVIMYQDNKTLTENINSSVSPQISSFHGAISLKTNEIATLTGKRHDHVLRDSRVMLVELYGENSLPNFGESYTASNGHSYPCYRLPKKEILVLVSGYSIKLRMKIITRLEYLEEQAKPENLSRLDILKMAMESEERRLALETENQKMLPKALFADAVSASTTSILVGELAKLLKQNGLKMGQNRLFSWLRENGFLIKRKGTDYNMPTQKSMELGVFEIKERTIVNPDDSTRVTKTPKVTGKINEDAEWAKHLAAYPEDRRQQPFFGTWVMMWSRMVKLS